MVQQAVTNFHVDYLDVTQHWSPTSEAYAGGDGLITALYNGWSMDRLVKAEQKWFAGMRSVMVYYCSLERNGQTMTMPVLNNPYVDRMLLKLDAEVVPVKR